MSRGGDADTVTYRLYGISQVLTITGPPYDTWIIGHPGVGANDDRTDDPDGDNMRNLLEFAFGTNPAVADAGRLTWTDPTFTYGGPQVSATAAAR